MLVEYFKQDILTIYIKYLNKWIVAHESLINVNLLNKLKALLRLLHS